MCTSSTTDTPWTMYELQYSSQVDIHVGPQVCIHIKTHKSGAVK